MVVAKDKRRSDFTDDEWVIFQMGYRHGADDSEYIAKAGEKLPLEKQGWAYLEGQLAGMKKVADFVEDNTLMVLRHDGVGYYNYEPIKDAVEWQEFKKEKGI